MIDLRSDTVTGPTAEMRAAMGRAEVGDDSYGEDPTVRRLEERAAELLGKEAALLVHSGTFANQLAIKVWTRPGQEVVVDAMSHILLVEPAATAILSGVALVALAPLYQAPALGALLAGNDAYSTNLKALVCVENTHNQAGGRVYAADELRRLQQVCRSHRLPLHVDGARLFNAAVALGVAPAALAGCTDSVMFCLSKGLACPVGSMLCGDRPFIDQAREMRQILGGGLRQSGILAAAGLVALESMVERLAEDHRHARILADGLAELPGLKLDPALVETNIVIFEVLDRPASDLVKALARREVLCWAVGPTKIRMVTHYEVSEEDMRRAIGAARDSLSPVPSTP
ncbi:MAG: aminotransferase class I/II-fold pyridoxal phosphate-dependent enzyme [Armatimonadetes bacterium]|nr:aminotransferase class I/II-fold pyridoxal phosphate-dependent enzyme [Armatimonadota bacterium]